jgi:hypothetical protein
MPDGKTPITNFNPNEFKVVDNNKKVVTDFNPNEFKVVGQSEVKSYGGDANAIVPIYKTPKDLEIDSAINFIDKQAVESGRIALTEERKGVLKDVLKNPNATKEQKEQAMLTVQGYDKDTSGDVSNKFYMQQDVNGVYVPKLLKHGQRPPKGTAINSFHGTQADANDDAWYTDLSKSLANGLVGAAGGVVDLVQAGQQLITGEESEILNDARNSVDFFKFKKDEDLNKSIYNTEGITKWADLLDKDRIDLTPSALWGTFNGLAESLSEFGFGTVVGGSLIKGAKAAKYGLQGVEKAVELGSAAQKGAIVFGSTIAQLGDVMEAGKEAGLKGRDLPAFALTTATAMGAIDAMAGLEGKVMSDLFKKSKSQILKNAIKTVERDAAGNITPQAFKELAKRTSIQYGEMAGNAGKEIVKDAIGEGTQEAVQDFTQKAAENLWDKMTDDERGQFGTDAFDAKSFGSYLNSFATGAISGVPMAIQQQASKKRNEEQSIHVYDRVKKGEEGVKALRVDLNEALANNDISQSEYEQANFKIDKYKQYHELTSKYNIDTKDEKRAFELSFQIEGMKTEIPKDENLISKLDPIQRSEVEADQSQVKTLQKELNEIMLRAKVKGEPTVGKKTEETIIKEKEKSVEEELSKIKTTLKEDETDANLQQKKNKKESDIEGLGKEKVITYPKLENKPYWKDDKRTYEEIDTEEFNNPSTDARTIHRVVRKEAYNKPNRKLFGNLTKRLYSYVNDKGDRMKGDVIEVTMEDGKKIRVASSKQEFKDENDRAVRWDDIFRRYFRSERTQGNEEGLPVGIRAVDLNNPLNEDKGPNYKPGKIALKVFDARTGKFLSWAKETKTGSAESLDKAGNELYTAEQKDLLKTLEQQMYNENPEGGDVIERLTKPKPKPTPTEKAKEATNKIVEEGKAKVKEQKGANKVTLNNISDIIKNGYGRLSVSKNGENIAFDKFDIAIDNDTKTAEVVFVQKKDRTANKGIGLESYIELGERLKEKGITLQSLGQPQLIGGRHVWDTLVKSGLAKRIAVGRYEYTGKTETENKSKSPSELSLSELNELPNRENVDEVNKQALSELNSINFNDKQSVKDGISKILEIINNKFIPENKVEQVLKTKEKLIGNNNYYTKEYLEKYIQYTTKDFSELTKEQKASVPLTITKAVRQQLLDLGYSNVNVDNMKPERALDIINKQETNKKEVSSEKESTKKEPTTKKDSSSLRRKIKGYNQLSSDEKKSEFGVNLRKEIQKEVEEFGGSLKPLLKGKIQLLDSEGKQVKKAPIKREQSVIDTEKAIAKKRKDALNTTPTSIPQYLAMVIGSKGQFAESVTINIPDVPSMMKDFKTGYNLESLLQGYKNRANLNDESVDESYFNLEAMNFLKEYLTEGGRDLAIDYAVEAYEREINDGYTDKEIKELEAYVKENNIKESDFEKDKELSQNVNAEEYIQITEKIENTNENERNEQLAKEISADYFGDEGEINDVFIKTESKKSGEEDIVRGEYGPDQFQKVSQRKGDITKVRDKIAASFPKINVEVNAGKFDESQSTVAGKVSADGKNIYLNPNYAGLDTVIHEAGHVLIDAMGYNNKVIQAAVKQLRTTPLYAETKERYKELSEQELDKEVLAEAIGREGADIFDKVEDRSKFKAYLDYIFDWLKQKLGMDKNIAKSLAKQIIGGVKTKNLEGTATGKEQLQKTDKEKKKPFAAQALKYNQYAMEEGFDAQKEFDKYEQATVELKEAKLEEKLAEEAADDAVTDEEIKAADAELEKQRALLKEASKEFAIKAKRYLGYLKYKKDFRAVQAILEDDNLDEYNIEELNDLITKLFAFNDRAAKSVKERAYQRLGHLVTVKQNEIHKDKEGFIEALGKTSDISPLQSKILHYSQFSEKNADMQALALANGKAIIDKITEANSLKDTHAKLGLKVIQEENKRLGIVGKAANRFSSDSSKYFEWMINKDGEYLTIDEAKKQGLSKAKLDYLDFHRETVAGYRESKSANDYENVKMGAIRVDKNFREAYKSEGLIPAFSYYLGGGATNLGRVRILHNGKVMSYSEIEKEIIAGVDKKNIKSIAKALYDLLVANIKARYQLKKGQNIDEKDNPLELKGDSEYSLNEKGQLVSKFDKPRAADRGYSKDFYKAMNQFIDESAHVKHISKIMPLVEAIEYLNKYGYMEEGYVPKKNVSKWINDWKALQIFKEPYVNDPVIDAAIKSLRKLVASTTMWFNIPANAINVFVGNYNNWRAENAETLARGNARLFGGKGSRKKVGIVNDYALAIIKKYNLVNQDFDSHPVIKAGSVFSKLATWGTQVGEYQIQGSLGLGLLSQEEFDSFEFTKDKYGNDVLTVKKGVDEDKIKSKMTQVKNRVTDIQGKYPDEDRRNIMRGEFGKALFQFKVWMPDWFKERFSARYFNAYGQEKEGSYTKMLRVGVKEMAADLKKGDIKKALTNPAFVQNLKGMATIGALLALKHGGDDDDDKKKGGLNWDSALSQVLFIFDLEQDKYMVSNPAAILGKIKDMLNAFEALVGFEEDAWQKTKRILPGGKAVTFVENQIK